MPSSILNSDDGVISGTSGLKNSGGDDGVLLIQTNGTTAQTVDSGQRTMFPTTIGVGGATPSASGFGISFPATQSASSDANTLDDYEEGSWTPTVTSTGGTYSNRSGRYTKIGRVVICDFIVQNATTFTYADNSAAYTITGLPFTPSAFAYEGAPGSMWSGTFNFNNVSGTSVSFVAPVASSAPSIVFRTSHTATGSNYVKNDNNGSFIVTGQVIYAV